MSHENMKVYLTSTIMPLCFPVILSWVLTANRERGTKNRSKLTDMVDLKPWLAVNGLTVRDCALELEVPLKTAQDWVYRGVVPSTANQDKLTEYVRAHCAHHWVIAVPNGPISEGTCQRCGQVREFTNSAEYASPLTKPRDTTGKAVEGKSAA